MAGKLYLILRDFNTQMKKQNISAYAASTAFFLFLSLVPMLAVICMVIPYTPLTEENMLMAVSDIVPEMIAPLAESLVMDVYEASAGVLSVAVIAVIWSAGKGVMALMRGLNAVNGVQEKRNYLAVRAVSSLYTVILLVAVIISLFIMVFGNKLVDIALYRVPQLHVVWEFLMNFRFLAAWVVLTLLFAAIYTYVPDKKLHFREQLNGAGFAAVVWSVFSWGFSMYVTYFNSYTIYGSLSIIIIVMVWMYFCMYIILIGAYLNRYFRPINVVLLNRR